MKKARHAPPVLDGNVAIDIINDATVSKSGDIKMGDFGIAKVLESTAAVAKTQIGT